MHYTANDFTDKRKDLGLTQDEFAVMLGITRSWLNKIEKGKIEVSEIIAYKFEQLHNKSAETTHIDKVKALSALKGDRNQELQGVPLYDIRATAGVIELFSRNAKYTPMDYIKVPNLPKCDGAITVTGDSMYPLLKSGDMVLYKEVNDKGNIIWGEMYLAAVVHNGDDFFCVKYLQQSKHQGYVRFVSYNEHHQPVEFPIDSIVALALVKASIRINSMF